MVTSSVTKPSIHTPRKRKFEAIEKKNKKKGSNKKKTLVWGTGMKILKNTHVFFHTAVA